jgi:hypothetical protein
MEGVGGLLPLEASHFKPIRQWQKGLAGGPAASKRES